VGTLFEKSAIKGAQQFSQKKTPNTHPALTPPHDKVQLWRCRGRGGTKARIGRREGAPTAKKRKTIQPQIQTGTCARSASHYCCSSTQIGQSLGGHRRSRRTGSSSELRRRAKAARKIGRQQHSRKKGTLSTHRTTRSGYSANSGASRRWSASGHIVQAIRGARAVSSFFKQVSSVTGSGNQTSTNEGPSDGETLHRQLTHPLRPLDVVSAFGRFGEAAPNNGLALEFRTAASTLSTGSRRGGCLGSWVGCSHGVGWFRRNRRQRAQSVQPHFNSS